MLLASRLLLITLASATLSAQFTGLATDLTGNVLYFSTNHRQANTNQPFHGKIFRWDTTSGLKLHSSIERIDPPPPTGPTTAPQGSNYYHQFLPEVLANGQLIYTNARRTCLRRCGFYETSGGILQIPNQPDQPIFGVNRFSPNGQYYLQQSTYFLTQATIRSIANPALANLQWIHNLQDSPRRVMANTGVAVVPTLENEISLLNEGGLTPILPRSDTFLSQPTIDSEATTVVFTATPPGAPSQIRKVNLPTGEHSTLSPTQLHCDSPSLSLDGNTAIFLCQQPAQVYLWRATNPTPIPITNTPAGIQSALLSGNGQFTFLLGNDGSLSRIPTDPRSLLPASLIVAPTPSFKSDTTINFGAAYNATPGSLFRIRGFGFTPTPTLASYPLPLSLDSRSFLYGDTPLPVVQISPTEALVQIPWDLPTINPSDPELKLTELRFRSPLAPIFENPPATLRILPYLPTGLTNSATNQVLAFDANFQNLLTPSNPPRPGDILHLYATGLGPTTPTVPTGQPAPLARITADLSCFVFTYTGFQNGQQNTVESSVEVLYAGLAPGLAGIYQVDLRLPSQLPPLDPNTIGNQHQLNCKIPEYGTALFFTFR